jgi:hypothetical protein
MEKFIYLYIERIESPKTCSFLYKSYFILRKKSILEKVNYLDQENYFLGCDDHNFHYRVRKLFNLDCAYLPVNIFCNRLEGSTRKIREGTNAQIFNYLKQNKTGSDDFKYFMKFYKPFKIISKIEF